MTHAAANALRNRLVFFVVVVRVCMKEKKERKRKKATFLSDHGIVHEYKARGRENDEIAAVHFFLPDGCPFPVTKEKEKEKKRKWGGEAVRDVPAQPYDPSICFCHLPSLVFSASALFSLNCSHMRMGAFYAKKMSRVQSRVESS